jgi:hypothetical protein
VTHYLGNDEIEELLGELGIKPGLLGKGSQSLDLLGLSQRIGRRQAMRGLELAHLLGDFESLSQ